ncbi:MAG: NAD(P)/FAD-dependent oxidoreductase [Thermodesulfobacteriota bacterium]
MSRSDVVVIGAGLAGLSCALRLHQAGFSVLVLEASDGVGGRVRTDELDGFLLDRGFQVFLMAYPEAQRVLDYAALDLHPFYPGALVRFNNRFYRVSDPWRLPLDALQAFFAPIGTFRDKIRIARLRQQVVKGLLEAVFRRPETSTIDALKAAGFSDSMIERFFRPFIGGVFLDGGLRISSRMFEFVYRMFSLGHAALPSRGMGAIPNHLASRLPEGAIRTRARVVSVHEGDVTLESGEMIKGRTVVLATEGPEAARLLGERVPPSRSVTCLYFASAEPPIIDPILALDGDGVGPVINLCVPSQVAPAYAPQGQSLVSATVLGNPDQSDEGLETAVRSQLILWFGRTVQEWRHLRTSRVIHALPMQIPPVHDPSSRSVQIRPWLFLCGEYGSVASIQWALFSGRRAAEAVIRAQGA